MKGLVTKGVGGLYEVRCEDGKTVTCFARKKLRTPSLYVGDYVTFSMQSKRGCIESVLPRRTALIRPPLVNVDRIFVVVAPQPEPDFLLVDKIFVYCVLQKIECVLIINKIDIAPDGFIERIRSQYDELCDIVTVSANNNTGLDALAQSIIGVSCFAGQSGVGKTSLLNALFEYEGKTAQEKTGELSIRLRRGRNTTRHCEIFPCGNGFLADTAGFTLLTLPESVKSSELATYFCDLTQHAQECRFSSCTHTAEPDCAVKKAVECGTIDKTRYSRYLTLYKEVVQWEKQRY